MSQGKQNFLTPDQTWYKRAKNTLQGNDTFYKTSLRYQANPDLQPKHVGMGWSIKDSCDVVKLNQQQMDERYKKTEGSMPLYKAYNIAENAKQTYDERLEQYPGPGSPIIHPSMQSNGFTEYTNSGGISKKDGLRRQINSIAEKIAEAKRIKGTLMLNNDKPNGGSWKTPKLDLALGSMSGFKGGETGQRFYTKFPVYRPREHGMPDVKDDLFRIYEQNTTPINKNSILGQKRNSSFVNKHTVNDIGLQKILNSSQLSRTLDRGNSVAEADTRSRVQSGKRLKMAGANTLQYVKRERFNEDTQSVIKEQLNKKPSNTKLTQGRLGGKLSGPQGDTRSNMSIGSKRSLTNSQLNRFFADGKQKIQDDTASRRSAAMSKAGSTFSKGRFDRRVQEEVPEAQPQMSEVVEKPEEEIGEIEYHSDAERFEEKQQEDDEDEYGDELSQAPTETLAREYKLLMAQYDQERGLRKQLEEEISALRDEGE